MASKPLNRVPVGALISIVLALAIGSAPIAALIVLTAKLGGVQ
jgi:hypothetical protein